MAKIAIDAGHYLRTPGKRCHKKLDANQTREWVLNDRVSDALATYLQSAGHQVKRVDDASGKAEVSLANRVKAANDWDADFYCSVHHNAAGRLFDGGGLEVYAYGKASAKSFEAQEAIYKHAIKRTNHKGNRSDGTPTANYYVCKYTNMPAVLVECGYMDSTVDIKYILDPEWSNEMALGIAEGICEVFGGIINADAKPEKDIYRPTVLQWQKAAIADGYKFPKYGADGVWGAECEGVAKEAIVKKRVTYTNKYLTKIVQQVVGVEVDGKCGKDTNEAIRAYQAKQGLKVDGAVGLNTWKKMLGV